MKKIAWLLVGCAVLMACVSGRAQEFSQVLVEGNPPITFSSVLAHVRLIEFVLGTRLTTAQKDQFRDTILKEVAGMDEQDRKDFLQAEQLLVSMRGMKEFELKAVYDVLRTDYEQSAGDDPDDHSGKLFLAVMKNLQERLAEGPQAIFTRQAFQALSEYLGLIGSTRDDLKTLVVDRAEVLAGAIQRDFAQLSEADQETLSAFDRRWHVLKAAWKGGDEARRQKWLTGMAAPFLASPTLDWSGRQGLEALAGTASWKEMAEFAETLGETETGYYATPTVSVW